MPAPSNSNALSLGRPVIDVSVIDTMDDVRNAFANVYTMLVGGGWPCAAKSGDTAYQWVYYRDNKLWGGKPSDPRNPDELTFSGGGSGYDTIQEDGVGLTQRTILNFGDGLTASDDAGNTRTNVVLSLTAGLYIDISGSTVSVDLTEVSGYNGAATQVLKNSTGTIEWAAESGGGGGSSGYLIGMITASVSAATMDGSAKTGVAGVGTTDTCTVMEFTGTGFNMVAEQVLGSDRVMTPINLTKTIMRASVAEPMLIVGFVATIDEVDYFLAVGPYDMRSLPGFDSAVAQIPFHGSAASDFELDGEDCP